MGPNWYGRYSFCFPEWEAEVPAIYRESIEVLELSIRALNCLENNWNCEGIETVGDLVKWSGDQLLERRNLGRVTLNEIKAALERHGLKLRG